MTDPTLFDELDKIERAEAKRDSDRAKREAGLIEGIARRDGALVRGARKADPAWIADAQKAIRKTATDLPEFIVDHVFERMDFTLSTHDDRAIGSLILEAAREGVIERTERFIPSFRAKHHACPRRVWRSRIYWRK